MAGRLALAPSACGLWPLPPAESFEFAVEWPFGGIGLTIIELDGAAIVAAAGRSAYYWPETELGNQPRPLARHVARLSWANLVRT
jgi:hypothetical protein